MDEDTEEARASVKKMCDDFLANLVIEKYNIEYPEPLEKEND
jgi:phosphoribosylformylglycinamidine (FGAM) synthase PurS component